MSAKVQIKGDTKDAQQKIQRLRKEVEKLDREAKKPKKVTVQGNNRLGGMGIGKGIGAGIGAGAVAGGNLITEIIKGLARVAPGLWKIQAMILGKMFGLRELDKAVTKVTPKIRNLATIMETLGAPGETALERADKLDALDDERRSHNSQSLAEEFAFSEAFSNVAGVNGSQIVDRVQALLDMATSGSISEMDRAWKLLNGFGVTYEDIQNGSTWQVLTKMLAAYNAAGADGENELEPAMQQIVGKRQMAAIRKIGDGTEMYSQAAQLAEEFNRVITNQQGILTAASQSELIRSQARIQQHYVPQAGEYLITNEANSRLSEEKLKTGIIGDVDTAWDSLKEYGIGIWDDIKPAYDEAVTKLDNLYREVLPDWLVGGGGGASDADTIIVNEADINVGHANPLVVEPPTEITSSGALTLLQNANTPVAPSILEPADNVTLPREPVNVVTAMGSTEAPVTLQRTETQMTEAIRQLTTELKNNTSASKGVSDVMRNLQVRNTTTSGGNSDVTNIATFA